MSKILIVEDEIITIDYLETILTKNGYQIFDIALSGEDVLEKITVYNMPDLILMDISLEGALNGIETAKILTRKYQIPIIFLTALSDKETLAEAKKSMPYGYIVKPFDEGKIVPMIEMVLYRTKRQKEVAHKIEEKESHIKVLENELESVRGEKKSIISLDKYIFDRKKGVLSCDGVEISLSSNEKKLITLLSQNINQIVSIESIENYIWQDDVVKDNTLRTLIWRLRKKVGDSFIQNSNKIGYKIVKDS